MNRKNSTRNALITSIISMLLCVSMLVGATFAWFTDEVKTGMNTIAAGNLDVELLADGNKVNPSTKLFDDVPRWEPGVVVYENLQVANVGNLALKYQMTLNIGNENNLQGHKLSEVLKVAIIDKVAATATREEVLAAAQAAVAADQGAGVLSNFYFTGDLEAGDVSQEKAIVIFWAPNAPEVDNLYNANNGKVTSDGKPLHIAFGIHLKAAQKMSESDSFGRDYDDIASVLPKATVKNVTAQYSNINATYGIGGAVNPVALELALQFQPNEKLDPLTDTLISQYKDYHVDFVVSADKPVAKDSIALAGYYTAWCQYNNYNWVAMVNAGEDIAANTEIRLVSLLNYTVAYEEICRYGNDGTGFLCGVADLTGENTGTTITVELRMYETDASKGALSTLASETGKYDVIGTYTYTIGGSYTTLDDGSVLLYTNNADKDVVLVDTQNVTAVNYTVPSDVTHIGNYAFSYNNTIETVTLPASVKDLGRGFDSNTTVKKVVLNEGLETISSRAFKSTTALEEVVIPSTVTVIEDNAFQKSGIKQIVIPATVQTVGETAFGASLIEEVTFEGNTSVQGYAFRGCPNLRKVTMKGDDNIFIPSTLNNRNSMWFCNSESNNPNTSNISFYVQNEVVASRVKIAMGPEADNTPVYINGQAAPVVIKNVKNITELQNALEQAVDGDVIAFAADITGDANFTQKAGVDVVINGCGYKFNGVLTVFGNGNQGGTESLAIKNINFVAANGADSCILSPDKTAQTPATYSYSHNVTVQSCTFTDPDGNVNCAAIRHSDGGDKNWVIEDCTVDNTMHSMLQVNNVIGKLTVTGCKVYSKNGLNLNSCTNVEITDCIVDVKGYCLRFGPSSGGNLSDVKTYTLTKCTLKSQCDGGDAAIMYRSSAVNSTLTLVDTTVDAATPVSGNTAQTTINGLN